jgi:hypothetical protein
MVIDERRKQRISGHWRKYAIRASREGKREDALLAIEKNTAVNIQ